MSSSTAGALGATPSGPGSARPDLVDGRTIIEPDGSVRSLIPARMDRLPWAKFHWMVVIGLGVSWILDGIEAQVVSNGGFQDTLHMTDSQVGHAATIYLIGQVLGALTFGRLTDKIGRKKLFIITLAVYLFGSGVAGLAWTTWFFYVFRFVAGLGIGGEYTAINSAIDELIPSKYRGRVDIGVNGTYWAGAMIGSVFNYFLLNPKLFPVNIGWRIGFLLGPVMGLLIIWLRRNIPETPRWLVTNGHAEEAEQVVSGIEETVRSQGHDLPPVAPEKMMHLKAREGVPFGELLHIFFKKYPSRTFLGLTMMITQSFLYNAIFFTYAMVLKEHYGISSSGVAVYFWPFAIGNLAGPLLLGRLFDTLGRRKMIFMTYGVSAVVLAVSAFLFKAGMLNATTHTIFWCVSFFFASAGASAAYLTVSEIFPLEVRGQAISYFFAASQLAGAFAPSIFAALVGDGKDRTPLFWGYILGASVMLFGGLVAWFFGVNAEGQTLEDVADPLSKIPVPAAVL